ncbi:hypothetical protein [Streptomyces sp. NPDC059398]|uniref:hypothetical protein n=1 Tax=Streptomyces sp. NPDC059398 TaxID=3346820 RepID=UPI0036B926EB
MTIGLATHLFLMLIVCVLGGAALAGIASLLWPMPFGAFAMIAVFVGITSWIPALAHIARKRTGADEL